MSESKVRHSEDEDPIEMANEMLSREDNRILSPRAEAMEGAPGPPAGEALDGQLGPDEISEPDEVVKNNEAKLHH